MEGGDVKNLKIPWCFFVICKKNWCVLWVGIRSNDARIWRPFPGHHAYSKTNSFWVSNLSFSWMALAISKVSMKPGNW